MNSQSPNLLIYLDSSWSNHFHNAHFQQKPKAAPVEADPYEIGIPLPSTCHLFIVALNPTNPKVTLGTKIQQLFPWAAPRPHHPHHHSAHSYTNLASDSGITKSTLIHKRYPHLASDSGITKRILARDGTVHQESSFYFLRFKLFNVQILIYLKDNENRYWFTLRTIKTDIDLP
jgi:hypothetical protein